MKLGLGESVTCVDGVGVSVLMCCWRNCNINNVYLKWCILRVCLVCKNIFLHFHILREMYIELMNANFNSGI